MPVRPIVAAYAGGIGLNSFLPAQAGTFAYFGMFRVIIAGSAFAGILAAGVVQNIFFGIVGALNYVFLFFSRPGSAEKAGDQVTADGGPKIVFLILAGLLLAFVIRFLWKRYRTVWEDAKAGAVILRHPRPLRHAGALGADRLVHLADLRNEASCTPSASLSRCATSS